MVEISDQGEVLSLEEKPQTPRSNLAVTGLYFYDYRIVEIAADLQPSGRGELEITDANRAYLASNDLYVEKLGRGITWLDTGTHESLLQASNFIQALQTRQGLMVACLEEIAYKLGYISASTVMRQASTMKGNAYGQYLTRMLEGD